MNKNAESLGMASGANGLSTVSWDNDTLRNYDISYITPRQGMNSPRVLLLRKTDYVRSGVIEFIFSHAWKG